MEIWEGFLLVMTQTKELCDEILALGKEKREVLVSGKTVGLDTIIKQEETLLLQLGKLETKRQSVIKTIAEASCVNIESLVLSDVERLAQPGIQAKLQKISAGIKNTVTEISELNQLNNRLIQQALFFVNCNINMLMENRAEPLYGGTNNTNTTRSRMLVDQKV